MESEVEIRTYLWGCVGNDKFLPRSFLRLKEGGAGGRGGAPSPPAVSGGGTALERLTPVSCEITPAAEKPGTF